MKRPKGNNNLIRKETYRVVIGAEQLVFVDAEDHVADGESGLKKNKKKNTFGWRKKITITTQVASNSYLLSDAFRLDVRDEDAAADVSVPAFNDHDAQSLRALKIKIAGQ